MLVIEQSGINQVKYFFQNSFDDSYSAIVENTHHEKCFESHEYIFEGVPHIREEHDEKLVVDVQVPSLHRWKSQTKAGK